MPAKVQIIVTRNSSWVWRAEAEIDPDLARPLTDEEFKMVKAALPKLLGNILDSSPEPAAPKRKK